MRTPGLGRPIHSTFIRHSFDNALFTYISASQAITSSHFGQQRTQRLWAISPSSIGSPHRYLWVWKSDDRRAFALLIDTGFHESAIRVSLSVNLNMHVASSLGDDATKSSHSWTTVRLTSPVIPASLQPSR